MRIWTLSFACIGIIALLAYALAMPANAQTPGGTIRRIVSGTVTCAATATKVDCPANTRSVVVKNNSTTAVYLGGSGVTTSNGFDVCATNCDVRAVGWDTADLWCRVAAGTVVVTTQCGQ